MNFIYNQIDILTTFIAQRTFYPCMCFYAWLSLVLVYFVRNDKNKGDQTLMESFSLANH